MRKRTKIRLNRRRAVGLLIKTFSLRCKDLLTIIIGFANNINGTLINAIVINIFCKTNCPSKIISEHFSLAECGFCINTILINITRIEGAQDGLNLISKNTI